jgi:hypothetical protein
MSVAAGAARRIGEQPVAYAWLLITAEIICSGSDAGGERAAAIYSLVGSATLTELDPHAYLRHVIERIADHPVNRIDELLPWRVDLQQNLESRLAA